MSKEMDDNKLLEFTRKGDRKAFRMLVEDNSKRLYSLAWRILGDKQAAEDAVQESFIKAYKQLEYFDGRSKVSTWLYRITTNTAIDMKRKLIRQPTVSINSSSHDDKDFIEITDNYSSPEQKQHQESLKREMAQAIQHLTEQERIAFTLKHHEGRTIDEISNILQLSKSSVKQSIFRSVKKLRESLGHLVLEQG